MSTAPGQERAVFNRLRQWLGYTLFVLALGYALYRAPAEVWQLQLEWVAVAALATLVVSAVQVLQLLVFLRHHQCQSNFVLPARLALRRAVLNAVLPARSGTLALVHMITRHYHLKWHEYVRFSVVSTVVSLAISGLALATLLLVPLYSFGLVTITALGGWFLAARFPSTYLRCLPLLLFLGVVLYVGFLAGFWSILRGMGVSIGFLPASYFAITLNALGTVSTTPGNMGVREIVLGAMAPYLSVSVSAGILAGAVFQALRLAVNGIALLGLERIGSRVASASD